MIWVHSFKHVKKRELIGSTARVELSRGGRRNHSSVTSEEVEFTVSGNILRGKKISTHQIAIPTPSEEVEFAVSRNIPLGKKISTHQSLMFYQRTGFGK